MTYEALIRPVMDYAAAAWFPNVKASPLHRLRVIQNAAPRLVTGCHGIASWLHFHAETKMLPVRCNFILRCWHLKFLASALRPSHPSRGVVNVPRGPRGREAHATLEMRLQRR